MEDIIKGYHPGEKSSETELLKILKFMQKIKNNKQFTKEQESCLKKVNKFEEGTLLNQMIRKVVKALNKLKKEKI